MLFGHLSLAFKINFLSTSNPVRFKFSKFLFKLNKSSPLAHPISINDFFLFNFSFFKILIRLIKISLGFMYLSFFV